MLSKVLHTGSALWALASDRPFLSSISSVGSQILSLRWVAVSAFTRHVIAPYSSLTAARRAGIPVACCSAGWQSSKDIQHWKVDALHHEFFVGSPALEIDSKILDPDYDFSFLKCAPSMFFQTPIIPFLTKHAVDTTIITGCVTSGCVRATAIDAFSYGYRTIVVDDCCGDPAADSHEANLRDINRRYADIHMSSDIIDYIERIRGRNAA